MVGEELQNVINDLELVINEEAESVGEGEEEDQEEKTGKDEEGATS